MKHALSSLLMAAVLCLSPSTTHAQTPPGSQGELGLYKLDVGSNVAGNNPVVRGAVPGTCCDTTITQNVDDTTVNVGNSTVACQLAGGITAENAWARCFPGSFFPTDFTLKCVDFGVEQNDGCMGDFDVDLRIVKLVPTAAFPALACPLPVGLVFGDFNLGQTWFDTPPEFQVLHLQTVTIPSGFTGIIQVTLSSLVTITAGSEIVIEVHAASRTTADGGDDGAFRVGSNEAGASGPTFIWSDDCGVTAYTDLEALNATFTADFVVRLDGSFGPSTDCNTIPDSCEPDCNANGISDACDIAGGASVDCNLDGLPDECGTVGGDVLPGDLLLASRQFSTIYAIDSATGSIRSLISGSELRNTCGLVRGIGDSLANAFRNSLLAFPDGRLFVRFSGVLLPGLYSVNTATGDRALLPGTNGPEWQSSGSLIALDANTILSTADQFGLAGEGSVLSYDLTTNITTIITSPTVGDGPTMNVPRGMALLDANTLVVVETGFLNSNGEVGVFLVDMTTGDRTFLSRLSPAPFVRNLIVGGLPAGTVTLGDDEGGSGPVSNREPRSATFVDGRLIVGQSIRRPDLVFSGGLFEIDPVTGNRALLVGEAFVDNGLVDTIVVLPPSNPLGIILSSLIGLQGIGNDELIFTSIFEQLIYRFNLATSALDVISDVPAQIDPSFAGTLRPSGLAVFAGTDCNGNGIADATDLIVGNSLDCNGNGIPDECDIGCTSQDCNLNGIPDECDPPGNDCNANGISDECDIISGFSQDCNLNGIPDECDIAGGAITQIIDATGDGAGNTLFDPWEIAVDAVGNAYATGQGSDNAFKITPAGLITKIIDMTGDGAGNGLDATWGIAVDGAGNVYVTGTFSNNAFKITPAGVITEIIDATGDGAGNVLIEPKDIAVDAAGNVYVSGASSNNAFKITPGGTITEIIDATGDGAGNGLVAPVGIAVDGAGNVYVTGEVSDNAFKITSAGVITEIIDATGDGAGNLLDRSRRIAVDAAGNVYVTGGFSDNVFKITPAGVITQIIDFTGDGAGNGLNQPEAIVVDVAGNAYVTGHISDNTFKITPAGVITEIIDFTGDGAGNGFDEPRGIAVDGAGNAYMVGRISNNAFKITHAGGSLDCNLNGIPDECELAGNDCNANGIPDECDITAGTSLDCNVNGIPDECDVPPSVGCPTALCLSGCSVDCNENCIPDECESDCNGNGIPDDCDIASGLSQDCNGNGLSDLCELEAGTAFDCNFNNILDVCEIPIGSPAPGGPFFCTINCDPDCNVNGIPDDCDINPADPDGNGTVSLDCNLNGIPDECELVGNDCNANGIPDECDPDCNNNLIADECEVPPIGIGLDCNGNLIPDQCEVPPLGAGADCNANGIPDACELIGNDCNANGIPDECDPDCNVNGIADECEVPPIGIGPDCNGNLIPDVCEVPPLGAGADCNANGIPDECELAGNDCNTNGIPDECDTDCNVNGIADECEVPPLGIGPDCNGNLIPDECEVDCNGNGIPDDCDIANCPIGDVTCDDCNNNGVPDFCDLIINGGTEPDVDLDGVPDRCSEFIGPGGANLFLIDESWNIAANWLPPIVPNNTLIRSFTPTIRQGIGALSVVLDVPGGATVDTLRLLSGPTLNIIGAGDLTIATPDGIQNDGTINIGAGRALRADSPFPLFGTSVVNLNDATAAITSLSGDTITSSVLIQGLGLIDADFNNQGIVSANNVIGGTLTVAGPNAKINDAQFRAITGGTLLITNTSVTGTGNYLADAGTIRLLPGPGQVGITGQTVVVTNNGLMELGTTADVQVIDELLVNSGGLLRAVPGVNLESPLISSATISAGRVSVAGIGCGGSVFVTGSMQMNVQNDVRVDGANAALAGNLLGCNPPILPKLGVSNSGVPLVGPVPTVLVNGALDVTFGIVELGGTANLQVVGPIRVNAGGLLQAEGGVNVESAIVSSATIQAGGMSISGIGCGGFTSVTGSMQMNVVGDARVDGTAAIAAENLLGCNPPILPKLGINNSGVPLVGPAPSVTITGFLDVISGVVELGGTANLQVVGPVRIDTGGELRAPVVVANQATVAASAATIDIGSGLMISGAGCGGEVSITDTMQMNVNGNTIVDGSGVVATNNALGCNPPLLNINGPAAPQPPGVFPTVSITGLLDVVSGAVSLGGSANLNVTNKITLGPGGVLESNATASSTISADSLLITTNIPVNAPADGNNNANVVGSGTFIRGTTQLSMSGNLQVDGCVAPPPLGCNPPILGITGPPSRNIGPGPTIDVNGSLILNGVVQVEVLGAVNFNLAGDFRNNSTNPLLFNWETSSINLDGVIQRFELAGEDRGPTPLGLLDNFAMDTLTIAAGTRVDFINDFDNVLGAGCEALYVRTLNLGVGSIVRLEGCIVYYQNLINDNNGAVIQRILNGDLVAFGSADMNGDGLVDEFDFAILLNEFGNCTGDPNPGIPSADLDGDGCVTFVDYQIWLVIYRDANGLPPAAMPIPGNVGDMNADGMVRGDDIQGFVTVLTNPGSVGFREGFVADFNGDGQYDTIDLAAFVEVLLAGG